MSLKGKKCPRPGMTVQTKGGLVGITTGACAARGAPVVELFGLGAHEFKRSELTKVSKRQDARLAEELAKVTAGGGKRAAAPAADPYWDLLNAEGPAPQPVPYGGHMYGTRKR